MSNRFDSKTLIRALKIFLALLAILSFFFIFFEYVHQLSHPMNSSPDGYWRLKKAVERSVNDYQTDNIWFPLYSHIVAIPLIFFSGQYFVSARLFTLCFHLTSSFFIFLIIHKITKNKLLSFIGSLIFLINPLSLSLSTQTLSEPIWGLFFISSLFFLFFTSQNVNFYLGSLLWSVSMQLRYESWYLTPLLLFLIYWHTHKKSKTFIFLIIQLIFPIYWILNTTKNTGSWNYYFQQKLIQASIGSPKIYGHLFKSFSVWSSLFSSIFSSLTIFVSIVLSPIKLKKVRHLWLIFVYLFLALVLQTFLKTMEFYPLRYLYFGITIIPILTISTIDQIFPVKYKKYFLIFLVISFELMNTLYQINRHIYNDWYLNDVGKTASFIKNQHSIEKIVYIKEELTDSTNTEANMWYLTGCPVGQYFNYDFDQYFKYSEDINAEQENSYFIYEKGLDNLINPKFQKFIQQRKTVYENNSFLVTYD
jgi:hypothetical protein